MVDAPPSQSVLDRLPRDCLKSQFCSSHWATPNALSLQSPGLAPCPSLVQSQVQPSQVSGCRFNRAPGQARPVGSTGVAGCRHPGCRLHQAEVLPGVPCLLYTWEFPRSLGNKDQSGNAAPTHLSADSTRAPILGCSHSAILSPPPYVSIFIFQIMSAE